MKVPAGFRFAGVHAGLKPARKDLALVVSDGPCAAAGCFTVNEARAAPVEDARRRLPADGIRAVVVNSGNANALTGPAGAADVRETLDALGRALGAPVDSLLAASTGVIGVRLPLGKITAALPRLVEALRPEPEPAAEAILTTDTMVKLAHRTFALDGREVTISAIAKGSGMIAPQLATMIAVVVTDCAIRPEPLQAALAAAMETSFDSLTVDGDMSTNDSVFALANGRAGNPPIEGPGPSFDAFAAALESLCRELARAIAQDGEGATRLLEVEVSGAPDFAAARDLARAVAGSNLVKAAFFGADPNWGRVLATVGARAGSRGWSLHPEEARVEIQGVEVYGPGGPRPFDAPALRAKLRGPEVRVAVVLPGGGGRATAWGCDLSYDYVKINADYSSLLVETEGGGVARDDRLTKYSPAFKVSLLVEVLSYISRLRGQRCVIKYGGAAMVKDSLKKAFCDDVALLRSVGLQPIVVHGGGPEISRTLDRLGHKSEFIDGVRVTPEADLKVVEMVLTGAINTELVTLLNQDGGHAVGLSGKDGALLRAKKQVPEDGRDLGQVGEITQVNRSFLEMLIKKGYVPVVSPVAIGEDGHSYNTNADAAAAAIASAISAEKLIYLTDVAGILENGELLSELRAEELSAKITGGAITGGMKVKARSILEALRGGVGRVHVVDGRIPHGVIAELFTDRGVGTLVLP